MPKLKKLNIQGNKLSNTGKANINALRMNQIHVNYRTVAERKKKDKRKWKKRNKRNKISYYANIREYEWKNK